MSDDIPIAEGTVEAAFFDVTEPSISHVFRDYDATDMNCNTVEFPTVTESDRTLDPVDEGERMPSTATTFEKQMLTFDKFGFEVTTEDSIDDVVEESEYLYASIASTIADKIYDSDVTVEWQHSESRSRMIGAAIEGAYRKATPDVDAVVVPEVLGEAIADEDPTRDWEEIAADSADTYGIDVLTDEYNVLRGSDMLVVDRDFFGYEAHRTEFETNVWEEYEEHDPATQTFVPEDEREVRQQVIQGYLRRGWAVLRDDKAYVARFCQLP